MPLLPLQIPAVGKTIPAQMQPCQFFVNVMNTSMLGSGFRSITTQMSAASLGSSSRFAGAQHQPAMPMGKRPHLRLADSCRSKLLLHGAFRHRRYRFNSAYATSSAYEDGSPQADASRCFASPSADSPATSSAVSEESLPTSSSAPVQFEIHRITGDGSCLFRAVAQGAHQISTGSAHSL